MIEDNLVKWGVTRLSETDEPSAVPFKLLQAGSQGPNIIRCGRRDLFSHRHHPAPSAGLSLILPLNAL